MDTALIIELVEIFSVLITASTMIARLTPTQDDDKIVEKVRKFFEYISNAFLPDINIKK